MNQFFARRGEERGKSHACTNASQEDVENLATGFRAHELADGALNEIDAWRQVIMCLCQPFAISKIEKGQPESSDGDEKVKEEHQLRRCPDK